MQLIPSHSLVIKPKNVDCVIYFYEKNGFIAKAYKGRKKRPVFHHWFKSSEQRAAFVERQINDWIQEAELNARYRSELDAKRNLELSQMQPGSILYASWGWEQTNINFYQVIERKGAKTLILREVKANRDHNAHDMSGYCVAIPDAFIGDPIVCQYGRGGAKVSDCQSAWLWDGKPKMYSCYA